MIAFDLKFEPPEPVWPAVEGETVRLAEDGAVVELVTLARGMESSLPSVALRIRCEDGSYTVMQTSARLFVAAARGMMGRYPELAD